MAMEIMSKMALVTWPGTLSLQTYFIEQIFSHQTPEKLLRKSGLLTDLIPSASHKLTGSNRRCRSTDTSCTD
jgi:hypothetical protein